VTSHALLSSESQNWQTPEWLLDYVRAVSPTGGIGFDPCTTSKNPTRARRYLAADAPMHDPPFAGPMHFGCWGNDGLAVDWPDMPDRGICYVNPPYGAHLSGPISPGYPIKRKGVIVGHGRGWGARIAAHRGETIALLPARTDAAWFRTVFAWADLVLFWSSTEHGARIAFVDQVIGKECSGSNLASMVCYRASEDWHRRMVGRDRFREVFGSHGTMSVGGARRVAVSETLSLALEGT
jgi:hypothetical protein